MRMLKTLNRPFYKSLPKGLVFVDYIGWDNNWTDGETTHLFEIGFKIENSVEYKKIGIVDDGTFYDIVDENGELINDGWIDLHADELCDLATTHAKGGIAF